MENIHIKVTTDTKSLIKAQAKKEGITMSALIKNAINNYLREANR